jgi:hypothetical protein
VVAGVPESVFDDDLEQLLSGEDCRADGMAQKEWRLDCWVDWLVDGTEAIGLGGCKRVGECDRGVGFCCAE